MKAFGVILIVAGAALIVIALIPQAVIGESEIYRHWGADAGQKEVGSDTYPTELGQFSVGYDFFYTRIQVRMWASASGNFEIGIGSETSYHQRYTIIYLTTSHQTIDLPRPVDDRQQAGYWHTLFVSRNTGAGHVFVNLDPAFAVYGEQYGGDGGGGATDCDEGWHWDTALERCVENDTSHDCPEGQHWNETRGECEDDYVPTDNTGPTGGDKEEDFWALCRFPWLLIIGIILILAGVFLR